MRPPTSEIRDPDEPLNRRTVQLEYLRLVKAFLEYCASLPVGDRTDEMVDRPNVWAERLARDTLTSAVGPARVKATLG